LDHGNTSSPFTVTTVVHLLEITTRSAGVIETIDIDRTIDTDTTTTSLSVFSN